MLKAIHTGIWLGVLDKPALDALGQQYYDEQASYRDSAYNRQGLWSWEETMLREHFPQGGRLLLAAAGGGREVYALHHLGFQIDAFECNAELVKFANQFLRLEGIPCSVVHSPCDQVPATEVRYDGVIVGWGAYMLIQGQGRRVDFLRSLRSRVDAGAPLLLSFFARTRGAPYFWLVWGLSNPLRRLSFREPVELGDSLASNFVHYFAEPELAAELAQAGFRLEAYGTSGYGHAVARAC